MRDSKAGPRMVPLTAPVKRVLKRVPRSPDDTWVFPRGNGKGRLRSLSYYWEAVRGSGRGWTTFGSMT